MTQDQQQQTPAPALGQPVVHFEIVAGDRVLKVKFPDTGDYGKFTRMEAGRLEVPSGVTQLKVRPVKEGWKPVNLKSLQLTPEK